MIPNCFLLPSYGGPYDSRNKMRLEKKFPKQPVDVLYSIILKLRNWGVLLQEEDMKRFDKACDILELWRKEFIKTGEQVTATTVVPF